ISGTAIVTVVVDDGYGGVALISFEVTVTNVVPDLVDIVASATTVDDASEDGTVTLTGSIQDLGLDTHVVTVNWGDGTVENVSVDQLADTFRGSHEYANGGLYSVVVSATDSNGASSGEYTFDAFVEGIGIVDGTLYIIGTNGRDDVKLKLDQKKNRLTVDAKFGQDRGHGRPGCGDDNRRDREKDRIKLTTTASDIERIVAFLRDGDDKYDGGGSDGGYGHGHQDADRINIRQLIFGGNGNDDLSGGRWMDAIFGGAGRDKIDGKDGNDILIGGEGRDYLKGGRGKDLLIGGLLGKDFSDGAFLDDIDAAMVEWASGNIADTLNSLGSIVDDNTADSLVGERKKDTLFPGVRDRWHR
ncbi:MAG: hypothetical protein KDB01_17225, partial [Planctomycetaceae bacterium]|nr:hypothetical protein [Planctomycetaceae bacterium]